MTKKRTKKYNPQKSLGYQRLAAVDLIPFFGGFKRFFDELLSNNFTYKRSEENDLQIKKIYVTTYIYNELSNKAIEEMNVVRQIINNAFTVFHTTNKNEYLFTEDEYNKLGQTIADCHYHAIGMIRRNWAYAVAKGCEYMELAFAIKPPVIGNYIDVYEMNQTLLKLFQKDGYITTKYLS